MKTTSSDPALLVGLDAPDDAAVYEVAPGVAIVQTVDFFTPVVDDPYAWGRIAAANAMSDVYAMGGRPLTALSLIGWPRSLDFELLGMVVEGAGAACDEAGVAIVGGHSVDDPEPKFGLAVTGVIDPHAVVRKTGGKPGDVLVLTKPLGMGVISSGIKSGDTSAATADQASRIMAELNRDAAEAMLEIRVSAATDVTGFGLVGHLLQMLEGQGLTARLDYEAIPILGEALDLARAGVVPGGSRRNEANLKHLVAAPQLDDAQRTILFDAQTSGGLLIAVPETRAHALLEALTRRGVTSSSRIGSLVVGDGRIEVGG